MTSITSGIPMPLSEIGLALSQKLGNGNTESSPQIICISKPNELIYQLPNNGVVDHYNECRKQTDGGDAVILADTQYIVLCPSFFSRAPAPLSPICPHVNRWTNRYSDRDYGDSIVHFQIFRLLHEIAHFYISATTQSHVDLYEINNCLKLDAGHARENPRSYEFYVASTFKLQALSPRRGFQG